MFLFFADSRCSLVYDLPAAAGTPEGVATLGSSERRKNSVGISRPADPGTLSQTKSERGLWPQGVIGGGAPLIVTLGGMKWSEAERNLPERLPCRPEVTEIAPKWGEKRG